MISKMDSATSIDYGSPKRLLANTTAHVLLPQDGEAYEEYASQETEASTALKEQYVTGPYNV